MKITKTASYFFFFGSISISSDVIDSSTFGFKTRRSSYFPSETGANSQTGALKGIKKINAIISEKLTSLVHFENVSFGIANQ